MTHTYKITGMTCAACRQKVETLLMNVKGVTKVVADSLKKQVHVTMNRHVDFNELAGALETYPRYRLEEIQPVHEIKDTDESKSWLQTYKPVLLVFAYIIAVTLIAQTANNSFNFMQWMNQFMAGFFLCFSFFKLLNVNGFASSYAMYDIIAKRWPVYGKVYIFIELALGLAYLLDINPVVLNAVTLLVMSVSLVGVLQSVLDKKKIKCACLGDVFNLPMSTLTIVEDGIMIAMSLYMLLQVTVLDNWC